MLVEFCIIETSIDISEKDILKTGFTSFYPNITKNYKKYCDFD